MPNMTTSALHFQINKYNPQNNIDFTMNDYYSTFQILLQL